MQNVEIGVTWGVKGHPRSLAMSPSYTYSAYDFLFNFNRK